VKKVDGNFKNKNMIKKSMKLTEEELTKFKNILQEQQKRVFRLGSIELSLNELQQELENLNNEKKMVLDQLKTSSHKHQTFSKEMGDKYGEGEVDINTGEIIK
jgi:tRNA isopentenyl-2-thiomethyl-A-37 hydroxylase MiaE